MSLISQHLILLGVGFFFKYIIMPFLVIIAFFGLCLYCSNKKDERFINARGGMREVYSRFFDEILKKQDARISIHDTSAIVIYRNDSAKYCKIDLFVTRQYTTVTFYILNNGGRWVTIGKEKCYGVSTGGDILMRVIFQFPDCDLSYNSNFNNLKSV